MLRIPRQQRVEYERPPEKPLPPLPVEGLNSRERLAMLLIIVVLIAILIPVVAVVKRKAHEDYDAAQRRGEIPEAAMPADAR